MKNEKPKVRFITLGCRVNQYETQSMRELLCREGFDPAGREVVCPETSDGAASQSSAKKIPCDVDFVVINTCTVTGEADRESRYWIRRAKREHPKARIVVTGCGIERDHASVKSMPEVDGLVFNREKSDIAKHLGAEAENGLLTEGSGRNKRGGACQFQPLSITCSEGRTRAFVKIQDGCNHACSFCKVVLVRGGSRSRPMDEVVREVEKLRDGGYRDIVFTGIQLGAYGRDISGKHEMLLPELLERCAAIAGVERLRLSSIEPTDITPDLIETIRGLPKGMPHLHVPLQSGDDDILRRMNRRYDSRFYQDLVKRLREAIPDFNLTLDVMAGFPGEEDRHFENTLELLEKVRPLKCHVFPYSRREGTRASRFPDAVAPAVIRERVKQLIALDEKLGREVMAGYVGREAEVLVEGRKNRKEKDAEEADGASAGSAARQSKRLYGHTPNFLKVGFRGEEAWVGSLVRVKLTGIADRMLTGACLA